MEEENQGVDWGYHYYTSCGMDTKHLIHPVVPCGVKCSLCGQCMIVDDVSGVFVEFVEEKEEE